MKTPISFWRVVIALMVFLLPLLLGVMGVYFATHFLRLVSNICFFSSL